LEFKHSIFLALVGSEWAEHQPAKYHCNSLSQCKEMAIIKFLK